MLGLVFHELRFKSNWRLIAQGAVAAALVVPALDADKELLFGGGVIGRHAPPQHLVFDFPDRAFHPGVVIGIAGSAHAGQPAMLFEKRARFMAGVLYAAI